MQHEDTITLLDILQSARLIQKFTKGLTQEDFEQNEMLQDAVVYRLAVIGEATVRVSEEFKNRQTEIPWKKMKAMRNILIHMYDDLDMQIIWDVVSQPIPELIVLLEPLVPNE